MMYQQKRTSMLSIDPDSSFNPWNILRWLASKTTNWTFQHVWLCVWIHNTCYPISWPTWCFFNGMHSRVCPFKWLYLDAFSYLGLTLSSWWIQLDYGLFKFRIVTNINVIAYCKAYFVLITPWALILDQTHLL